MRNRAIALANTIINPPLRRCVEYLDARRAVFNETEDAATQDAAYMDVLAAQMALRAEIHRARLALAAKIEAANPAEAQRIRESLQGGVA
jgi:hypothetical protein